MPIIREMRNEDIEAVMVIENELFTDPWTREMYEEEVSAHLTWVLEEDGEICGYACGWRLLDEFQLTNIGVELGNQRKGWGRMLLLHVLVEQFRAGCRSVFLEVRAANTPAIALYEDFGFERLGLRLNYYRHPVEDAIVMGLRMNDEFLQQNPEGS